MKNLQKYNITNIHRIHHEKCSIMFIHDLKKKNLGYTQINRLLLFDLRRKQNNALFNNMLTMYQKKNKHC